MHAGLAEHSAVVAVAISPTAGGVDEIGVRDVVRRTVESFFYGIVPPPAVGPGPDGT
jgi:hypothetical protein